MEITIIDTRNIEHIENAAYFCNERGMGVYYAYSADGELVGRFKFGNGNVSNAMACKAGGVEVYRDGYGYFGAKSDLEAVFERRGATYFRRTR